MIVGGVSLAFTAVMLTMGHSGMHMLQNILVPGLGLHERSLVLAIATFISVIAGLIAWIRWGIDWLPATLVVLSTLASGVPTESLGQDHASTNPLVLQYAAHEFPIVVAVVAALIWLQTSIKSLPLIRRIAATRVENAPQSIAELPPVACSQAAVISILSGSKSQNAAAAAANESVTQRCRWIGRVARFRFGDDPFMVDHGIARAGLLITGQLSENQKAQLMRDSTRAPGGVPCSEPGWLRFLDGTLTAVALTEAGDKTAGERWTQMLDGPLAIKRGHRPAMWWTPLGIAFGNAPLWEHALGCALARDYGWCSDKDWEGLRPRLLGAAARGVQIVDDERAIAAGRLWLDIVKDEQASRILMRPTVQYDPIALEIEALREQLAVTSAAPETQD